MLRACLAVLFFVFSSSSFAAEKGIARSQVILNIREVRTVSDISNHLRLNRKDLKSLKNDLSTRKLANTKVTPVRIINNEIVFKNSSGSSLRIGLPNEKSRAVTLNGKKFAKAVSYQEAKLLIANLKSRKASFFSYFLPEVYAASVEDQANEVFQAAAISYTTSWQTTNQVRDLNFEQTEEMISAAYNGQRGGEESEGYSMLFNNREGTILFRNTRDNCSSTADMRTGRVNTVTPRNAEACSAPNLLDESGPLAAFPVAAMNCCSRNGCEQRLRQQVQNKLRELRAQAPASNRNLNAN